MNMQYKLGNPHDGHVSFDATKALTRRLEYLKQQIDSIERPRLSYAKAEMQAIRYALECIEYTKIEFNATRAASVEEELTKLSPEDASAMREYMNFRKARAKKECNDLLATDTPSDHSSHSDAPKPHHHKEGVK